MKRDLTNSRTYVPPRVKVVEACTEQSILQMSRQATFNVYVDESETVDMEAAGEKYWVEF